MKKIVTCLLLSASLIGLFFLLGNVMRTTSRLLPVVFATPSVKQVKSIVRHSLYTGYGHLNGSYLDRGLTTISFKDDKGAEFLFTKEEELELVGIHSNGGLFYLIFSAEYKPERGFLVYKTVGASFMEIPLTELPFEVAFANVGSKGMNAKRFFSIPVPAQPSIDFYETATAWLWSQMTTGAPVLGQRSLDIAAIDKVWKMWARSIATKQEGVGGDS